MSSQTHPANANVSVPLDPSELEASSLFSLQNQIALITGGGTGIGLMIAHGLAANGAKVYITGRRIDVLRSVSGPYGRMGGEIVPLQMDVTSKPSILTSVSHIESTDSKLHILINNAGQSGPLDPFIPLRTLHPSASSFGSSLFASSSPQDWGAHFEVNVASAYFVSTAFLGLLEKGAKDLGAGKTGVIVNVTSVSGIMKLAQDHFCYNTAKAGLSHLTRLLSTELALRDIPIRVNAVAPGPWRSEMSGDLPLDDAEAADALSKPIISPPAGRGGTEQEMAATVLYIVSQGGAYMNGQEIVIDGGYLAVNPSTR
ncbi:NAD(P)-binding protein [Sistotremastrum suecicum HHB10207 ss-3]|uniref:NAD(P)-binding protein n=1 Tax=Sistotremastrum suecicum HHB10207 ss-3 TaxID=1314776 RepID=A0A165ZT10_9AGAM|nr:NAD(P)-binding protein [Sistotremastrum suecicum HHB10207 ss-3]